MDKLSFPFYFICKLCKKKIHQWNDMFMMNDYIFCSYACRYEMAIKKISV